MCIGGNQAFGITHTINFKPMTTINTDYSNTELLDQDLDFNELSVIVAGHSDACKRQSSFSTSWTLAQAGTLGMASIHDLANGSPMAKEDQRLRKIATGSCPTKGCSNSWH